MLQINYWAVLVAGIANLVIGGLWYGPIFGKPWTKMMGWTKETMAQKMEEMKKTGDMWKMYAVQFVSALVMAYVFANFIGALGVLTAGSAIALAFWIWLGFIATTQIASILWEGKPAKLYILNVAYYIVNLCVMALIFAYWK